jgi:beta-lactamase class A
MYMSKNLVSAPLMRQEARHKVFFRPLFSVCFGLLFLLSPSLFAAKYDVWPREVTRLPVSVPNLPELGSFRDGDLQNALRQNLCSNARCAELTRNKKMAVGLVDLRDLRNIRFASTNGREMMYAASLPKIAILLAAMDALEKHEIPETPEVREDMHMMIAKSSNQAATRMIDRVGFEKIEEVLTNPNYSLYDEDKGGGLWVGKRYASQGRRYPDPMKGLSHAATVDQVCKFYYMLVFGKLVSYERSRQMLEMMCSPKLHHKFVNTLEKTTKGAHIYRKSGTWQNFHADSALVWGPRRRYILVSLVEDDNGEDILRHLVDSADEVLQIFK